MSRRESDAILTYIVDKYDPEHKISAATEEDKYRQLQWLFFQASGQGPYFGQAAWFSYFHPEKIPSAQERYRNEILRVLGVLDGVIAKQEWLVAGKPTIADLSFITCVFPVFVGVWTWTHSCAGCQVEPVRAEHTQLPDRGLRH